MKEKRTPKSICEMEIRKNRPRGRPRDRWLKGAEECVRKRGQDWTIVNAKKWWGVQEVMARFMFQADPACGWKLY